MDNEDNKDPQDSKDSAGETGKQPTVDKQQVKREKDKIARRKKYFRMLRNTFAVLIVVAAIAVLISTLFMPVIQVSGDSMEPTLKDGDILLLVKTKNFDCGDLCCVSWHNKMLLKRVIGLPGDKIDIDSDGNVSVNGKVLDEPYAQDKSLGECDVQFPLTVPENSLFILGDKRASSIDSRSSAIGCVDKEQVIGRVLFTLWSS
ncbi:MAG: signal peptidase I [Ruminococcus sp.]|nr:signal peptidase I [Ruminococcus sp.]